MVAVFSLNEKRPLWIEPWKIHNILVLFSRAVSGSPCQAGSALPPDGLSTHSWRGWTRGLVPGKVTRMPSPSAAGDLRQKVPLFPAVASIQDQLHNCGPSAKWKYPGPQTNENFKMATAEPFWAWALVCEGALWAHRPGCLWFWQMISHSFWALEFWKFSLLGYTSEARHGPQRTQGRTQGFLSGSPPRITHTTAGNDFLTWLFAQISASSHFIGRAPRSWKHLGFNLCLLVTWGPGVIRERRTAAWSAGLLELFTGLRRGPTVNRKVQTHAALAANENHPLLSLNPNTQRFVFMQELRPCVLLAALC